MTIVDWRAMIAVGGAAALAACSASPARVGSVPTPAAAKAAEIDAVFDLLMNGDENAARKKLKAILKRDPMSATAKMLGDSIARDPRELLGPQSYSYVVRPGDTMPSIAQRLLGNRLKAYQLLRYNGLKAPAALAAGQAIRVPGQAPRAEPARRADPAPARPSPAPVAPRPASSLPRPAAPSADPGAARQLRTAGLAALNQGSVDHAVGLLRRAARLDPGNPMIARDLARAERIAATVRARR